MRQDTSMSQPSMCTRLPRLLSAALLAATLGACENRTLAVKTPDIATPGSLDNAGSLPQWSAAVIATFSQSYAGDGGGYEGIILDAGLLGDEIISSDTYPTRIQIDSRATQTSNAQNLADFQDIQNGRTIAEEAIQEYTKFQPGSYLQAEAYSFAGIAYTLMGETFCTGIPFSSVNLTTGVTTFGPLESTNQMWGDAHARYDSALTLLAADNTDPASSVQNEQYLAEILAARTLLDSGDYVDAAALVTNVPDGYLYSVGYSLNTTGQYNGVYEFSNGEKRYSMSDVEGGTGLPYRSDNDPRVVWFNNGTGFNNATTNYAQLKYPGEAFPIPVATGVEGLLIQAEAAFNTSGPSAALPFINRARAAWNTINVQLNSIASPSDVVGPMPADSLPSGTPGLLVIFKERAYDLWLTAHRLGDERRLIRQYGFTSSQVFPIGPYPLGGSYGNEVALVLPDAEQSNPNYATCSPTTP
jgi:starch-binding outer membrane protein, SusD/RagB family